MYVGAGLASARPIRNTWEEKNMKVAMLGGALKNAGDFLITQRSKEVIEKVNPNADVTVF